MHSETGERRAARVRDGGAQPLEPEHLPCPRCESTNTKFCYYNNYNLSQPRYFCKSCRRYWTRGGTLRNVPFGGGTRRNPNKRSRTTTPPPPPLPANQISVLPGPEFFGSVLNPAGNGLFALGGSGFGFGLEPGSVFREMGFGLGGGSSYDTWQLGSVEGVLAEGDYFGWPGLAISTPSNGLK